MFFKQITSESTFDKIPSRPFLPRKAQVTARCPWFQWGISMTKSEKSNWRFFPNFFGELMISWWYHDDIWFSIMIDHQPEAEKTIWKNHICFRESHRFQWPFQWVSPGHKGAMFVDFMGHLQQIMAILNLENPQLGTVYMDVSQNWKTKELVSQRKPLHSSFLQCLGPEPATFSQRCREQQRMFGNLWVVWRSSASGGI